MKSFLKLALLVTLGLSADIWTQFVNEQGEEYVTGAELAANFNKPERGGNGGSGWSDDCDGKGGLAKIGMKCGNYVGMLQLHCAKQKLGERGLGLGHGRGNVQELTPANGINKIIIAAGRYVDRITLFRDGKEIKQCGRSKGGNKYTVEAPKGYELCAFKGRSGWWMDKLAAGWCKKPCPGHCVFKPPPPKPTDFKKTPLKYDGNSSNKGDQIRKWFDGAKLAGGPDKIVGSVQYRDQAWGNKKTDVFFCCNCGKTVQDGKNCVALCGTNVRNWKTCKFDKAVPSTCKKGSTTCVAYRVGGGGGHKFYGRNFNGKVTYKSALLEALDITFDGLFVSSVEYAEQETSYITNVAVGFGGLLAGLAGTFFMRRRQQTVEYSSLL